VVLERALEDRGHGGAALSGRVEAVPPLVVLCLVTADLVAPFVPDGPGGALSDLRPGALHRSADLRPIRVVLVRKPREGIAQGGGPPVRGYSPPRGPVLRRQRLSGRRSRIRGTPGGNPIGAPVTPLLSPLTRATGLLHGERRFRQAVARHREELFAGGEDAHVVLLVDRLLGVALDPGGKDAKAAP